MVVLILLGSALNGAFADEGKPDTAEYVRLQQELELLVSRNAWGGVERTYTAMLATGATLIHTDHVAGAHAARARGDITQARKRLMEATELEENKEVLEWLWEIDSVCGRVFMAGDRGKTQLAASALPFNPDLRKAVEFAVAQVDETGMYDGYLPQGQYVFTSKGREPETLEVVPRVQSVRIDHRTAGGLSNKEIRRIEKEQKKNKKK